MKPNTSKTLELHSSAITLSDMEVFIFPELMFSLVLANIMSPRIWQWREDPWFDGIESMKPYKRITRLKQFIMDHYIFNLDLDTWGLTSKEKELARFSEFIDESTLARSNALFGYEGDKYYFDIDIRRHFGLDKYEGNIIPYWKTETVEAMDAFKYMPGYETGAGECVSLAALYAAALFIIARIPLEDIYMMATPLHSQNLVDVNDGILTNNRRLVTKNMWFNGTALSAQARRALENEQVTIVSHISGWIHVLYPEATIAPVAFERFSSRIRNFLSAPLSVELLSNFLRQNRDYQSCFQLSFMRHGIPHYCAMERVFAYEHGTPYKVSDSTRKKLLQEIEGEELMHDPLPDRIIFNDVEDFVKRNHLSIHNPEHAAKLKEKFSHDCLDACEIIDDLVRFCHVEPRLPNAAQKEFIPLHPPLKITPEMSREEITATLAELRDSNPLADLAFRAFRDLRKTDAAPFLKAAFERNPVAIEESANLDPEAVIARLNEMPNESIYDGPGRLAQPDEVWNFGRGDGLEKAITIADILFARDSSPVKIEITETTATIICGETRAKFATSKELPPQTWTWPLA